MRPEGRPAHVRTGIILNDLLIYSDGHIGQGSDSGTDSEREGKIPVRFVLSSVCISSGMSHAPSSGSKQRPVYQNPQREERNK